MPNIIPRRSDAVARGLVVTGRAGEAVEEGDWLKAPVLRGTRGTFYWISTTSDGRLLRGADVGSAAELRREFASAMRERGATKV